MTFTWWILSLTLAALAWAAVCVSVFDQPLATVVAWAGGVGIGWTWGTRVPMQY